MQTHFITGLAEHSRCSECSLQIVKFPSILDHCFFFITVLAEHSRCSECSLQMVKTKPESPSITKSSKWKAGKVFTSMILTIFQSLKYLGCPYVTGTAPWPALLCWGPRLSGPAEAPILPSFLPTWNEKFMEVKNILSSGTVTFF